MSENITTNEATSSTKQPEYYNIDVLVSRIKGEKDGKKYDFAAYEAIDKRGRKSKLKFRKDVKNKPLEEAGRYILVVNKRDINMDKTTIYPTYWVRDFVSMEPKDLEDVENYEELPF